MNESRTDLRDLKARIIQAIRVGNLRSYDRQKPAERSMILLATARKDLEDWIKINGEGSEALRLLALIQESLLQYGSAIKTLERLISSTQSPDRKDQTRLAMCKQALTELQNNKRPRKKDPDLPPPGALP